MPLRINKKDLQQLLVDYAAFVSAHNETDIHTRLVGAAEHIANTVKELRSYQKANDQAPKIDDMELLEILRRVVLKAFENKLTVHLVLGSLDEGIAAADGKVGTKH